MDKDILMENALFGIILNSISTDPVINIYVPCCSTCRLHLILFAIKSVIRSWQACFRSFRVVNRPAEMYQGNTTLALWFHHSSAQIASSYVQATLDPPYSSIVHPF